MIALGISQDLYSSGVALSDGGALVYANNEERYTRRKNDGGFPHRALEGLFAYTGVAPEDIGAVCVAGILTPPFLFRVFPALQSGFHDLQEDRADTWVRRLSNVVIRYTPMNYAPSRRAMQAMARPLVPGLVRRQLPAAMGGASLRVVEHHRTHAAAAFGLSGFEDALILTADGMGDGIALAFHTGAGGRVQQRWSVPQRASYGLFFEMLTEAFGFIPSRHEGKLTGLAAHGNPGIVTVPSPFNVKHRSVRYRGPSGPAGVRWIREELLPRFGRENVAAWAQAILEDGVLQLVREEVSATGLRRVALAGGIFGNVKLNQRIHEIDGVEDIFVLPNMGDGGNAVGALCAEGFLAPARITDVFLGDDCDAAAITVAMHDAGVTGTRHEAVEAAAAAVLAEGKIVARCTGRMEWGPRALGNRSVLAPATDPGLVSRLNTQLRRNDFMPFAPALLAEDAGELLRDMRGAEHTAEFMTVCFNCSDAMRTRFPGVVHVDGTARAQLVRAATNPGFHRLLSAYKAQTGDPLLLNTSFNIHEEPIVQTPTEAITAYRQAGLDALALGDWLITG